MADAAISQLTAITATDIADTDEIAVFDASGAVTKRITIAELRQALSAVTIDTTNSSGSYNQSANAVNQVGKYTGKMVMTTTGGARLFVALGPNPTDPWALEDFTQNSP